MTREQGYRLYYWIFEAEDEHAGQTYYGPAQGMIHTIPFIKSNSHTFQYDSINLGEIIIADYYNNDYDCFDTKETTDDLNEFSGLLADEYIEFIQFLNTTSGKHTLLHILAHNNFIKGVYQSRLKLWDKIIKFYVNKSISVEEIIDSLNIKWPSTKTRFLFEDFSVLSEYDKIFGEEYQNLGKLLFDEDRFPRGSMLVVANIIEEAFRVNKEYNSFKQRVIKALSSSNSFNNETPWETSTNNNFETILKRMEEIYDSNHAHEDLLFKITSKLTESRESNQNEHKELLNLLSNPESKPYRLGVELGVFERGDDKDPRYIIRGKVRTSLKLWVEYLIKQGYKKTELPTGASIRGRLRRANCHKDIKMENKVIESAMHFVKYNLKDLE